MPENKEACTPLDSAQIARRFVLKSDTDVEDRVLHNKGKPARALASELAGRPPDDSAWEMFDFDLKDGPDLRETLPYRENLLAILIRRGKFGLVTNFHIYDAFKEAAEEEARNFKEAMEKVDKAGKKDQLALGYRLFDGYSEDTKGVPVTVEFDEADEKQKLLTRLRGLWKEQLADIEKKAQERKRMQAIPERWQGTGEATSNSNNDPTPGSDGRGKHGMVLLGTYKKYKEDALTRRERDHVYFMLLNSWHSMPLVLVSPEYLVACGAKGYVIKDKLGEPAAALDRDARVCGECNFFDGGDENDASCTPFFTTSVDEFHD